MKFAIFNFNKPRSNRTHGMVGRQRGFTIVEMLVALGIGAAVATTITVVTSVGLKNVGATKKRERLQSNAVFLTDALAYWIKQGVELDTPASDTLEVIVPDATTTRTIVFKKNGNRVTLDGAALTSDDIKVQALSFTRLPRSARIAFTLESTDGEVAFSATTAAARRNEL